METCLRLHFFLLGGMRINGLMKNEIVRDSPLFLRMKINLKPESIFTYWINLFMESLINRIDLWLPIDFSLSLIFGSESIFTQITMCHSQKKKSNVEKASKTNIDK